MSLSGSSASRNSIWAMTRLDITSSMTEPRNTILSFRSLENMSYALSPLPVCSTTIGTRDMSLNLRFPEWPPHGLETGLRHQELRHLPFEEIVLEPFHVFLGLEPVLHLVDADLLEARD